MRIASNTVSDTLIRQIQNLGTTQAKLQNEVSTGQRIFQAEDDPAAVGRVLNFQSEQRQVAQYSRNASRALDIAQSTSSDLQSIKKISDRATQIGTLGSSVLSSDAASSYATELDQLIEQAVQSGNSKLGNDYLFGGTAVDTPPYAVTRDANGQITSVAYAGNSSQASVQLGDNTAVSPGTDGTTNSGIGSFINQLISLRDALKNNDSTAVSTAQTHLLSSEDTLVSSIAENGAVQTRIQAAQSQQTDLTSNLEKMISTDADADLPTTVVKLTQTQTAYQAALQSAASIMKTSLMDYLH